MIGIIGAGLLSAFVAAVATLAGSSAGLDRALVVDIARAPEPSPIDGLSISLNRKYEPATDSLIFGTLMLQPDSNVDDLWAQFHGMLPSIYVTGLIQRLLKRRESARKRCAANQEGLFQLDDAFLCWRISSEQSVTFDATLLVAFELSKNESIPFALRLKELDRFLLRWRDTSENNDG